MPPTRERRATNGVLLEVCVASVADALAARDGGADRLEMNSALALGGLTPSLGLWREVRQAVDLPIVAMLRPRGGGFRYTATEFNVMRRDADVLLAEGADGLALGILQDDGALDAIRCRQIVEQATGREIIFHRAFDFLPDGLTALDELAEIGVCRVMTSGQRDTALAGADPIAKLVERAGRHIEILPCGKIDAVTAPELLARTGCRQVHAALRETHIDPLAAERAEQMYAAGGREMAVHEATSLAAVQALRAALDAG